MFYSLANLGSVAHGRGRDALALTRYQEALRLLGAVPNKPALAKTLEDVAIAVGALGDPARAARLLGAGDALRRAMGSPLFPAEREEYETEVAAVRQTLGDSAFETQWRIGTSMTLERALEEALAAEPPASTPAAVAAPVRSARRRPETPAAPWARR
jgi:hypothetical protein